MTQACRPGWPEATDPRVLPRHDPDALVQTADDDAKQSVRGNQQGNIRLATRVARSVWSTVWKSSLVFRHRSDAPRLNDGSPNCAQRPESDRTDAEQWPWLHEEILSHQPPRLKHWTRECYRKDGSLDP